MLRREAASTAGDEGDHDVGRPQHVRMHGAQPGALADRANPPVSRAAVEALTVPPSQDRAFVAFADRQIDRASRPRHERDRRRLVPLAENVQRPMAAFDAEVLDVGRARLAHTQPVQAEQHRERSVIAVVLLGGEQEHGELGAVEASGVRWMHLWSRTYSTGFEAIRPSM